MKLSRIGKVVLAAFFLLSLCAEAQQLQLVKDMNPGAMGSGASTAPAGYHTGPLALMNSVLYFKAADGVNGNELWRSDGTNAGTWMVKNINPGGNSDVTCITNCNGTLYMQADDGVNGAELWKSDGTNAGTLLLKNIFPRSGNSYPRCFYYFDGFTYFAAAPTEYTAFQPYTMKIPAFEFYRTDGSAAGTVIVKDLNPKNKEGSQPMGFIAYQNRLHFLGRDNGCGFERWSTNGSAAGTVRLLDLASGSMDGIDGSEDWHDRPVLYDGCLFFQGRNASSGYELFKTNGTAAGTTLVKDIQPDAATTDNYMRPLYLTVCNGLMYFAHSDGVNGNELWRSDGTAAGTWMVADINPAGSSLPNNLTAIGNTLLFTADDGTHGREVWKVEPSTGLPILVKDIVPGSAGSDPNYGSKGYYGSFFQYFVELHELAYFTANDGATGFELWRTDGTAAGTVLVADLNPGVAASTPRQPVVLNAKLYVFADDGVHGHELFVYAPPVPKPRWDARFDVSTAGFQLGRNFPDPFHTSTTIEYIVPEDARARLAVLDALGREVAVLADGLVTAGRHCVSFDAASLPAGSYVFMLEANGGVLHRVAHLVR